MSVFDSIENVARYEAWFASHRAVFESEAAALRTLLPHGTGFEVGIGTGIFARKLGIRMGNDPSEAMLELARKRGLLVYRCTGDRLPFHDGYFDFTLMVTTICFLDNPGAVLNECRRVVGPNGSIIVGFVDGESPVGRAYQNQAQRSVFYRDATFYSTGQVRQMLHDAGFSIDGVQQTLFAPLSSITSAETPREGWGEGSFVVVRGRSRQPV
ncbi:MAG: methyltransferase domain-containing protein [Chitinivibrionales bacterium]|nr:methyltransferase domain-containing protein [Chitinivibrionales bacterium]MBD3396435.1 methyltransferase domain-containing protein [Chitinivibrionales bacterium]